MFSSSFEYLQALRDGDYLYFLEWPAFIAQKYGGKKEFGADALLDCLIFEWLDLGYIEEDIENITILYAVYEREYSPLEAGKYAYPLMTLMTAFFSCMSYRFYSLHEHALHGAMNVKQVMSLMEKKASQIEKDLLNQSNALMRTDFMNKIHLVDQALVDAVEKKILAITRPLSYLEKYIHALSLVQAQGAGNSLLGARLALAQRFYSYLRIQNELTDETSQELHVYVNAIRVKQPEVWEEEYLQMICPSTLIERTVSIFTSLAPRFFTFVGLNETPDMSTAEPKKGN